MTGDLWLGLMTGEMWLVICDCWTSESDRFYEITFVRKYVRNELISEIALTIFLKLGMKLGDNKGKKIARPDFW